MLKSQLFNPRKRRYSEELSHRDNQTSQPGCKRTKHRQHCESYFPPTFWDNLSRVDLTKRALEELDRRNAQVEPNSNPPYRRLRRYITRGSLAVLRKNHPAACSAAEFLCLCGKEGLKEIKQFAKLGGPNMSDVRGFPEPTDPLNQAPGMTRHNSRPRKLPSSSASKSRSTSKTGTTRSVGPYNRNFEQNLIDGGIYPEGYTYPDGRLPAEPDNWEEINRRLSLPRRSLSPSKFSLEDFKKFRQANVNAVKEKQVTTSVIPTIEGDIIDSKCVSGGIPFTNLDHLTDGGIVPGNPDIYYGARPEQLDRQVRDELGRYIIPSTQDNLPTVPNFFLAVKGPDGSLSVAGRQAAYDGALGARGIYSLQTYKQDNSDFDNNAYTITSIYHGGQLKMYTSYPVRPPIPGSRPEYYMHQINTWGMTGNIETFRQGATAYRNARDWTTEQRDEAIRQANTRASDSQSTVTAVDMSFGQTYSFAGEAALEEISSTILVAQDSQASLGDDPNTTTDLQDSDSPTDEFSPGRELHVKRSNKYSEQSRKSKEKRRKADDFEDDKQGG